MSTNYSLSRLERLYLQNQPTFGVIPGGNLSSPTTATVTGTNCCRFIRMRLSKETAVIVRPDKTGSRSQTVGILGRAFGRWNMEMSFAGHGTAGTVPDCDPLLEALFGQPATVVGGTSCTYTFNDNIPMVTIWSFRQPSTLDQRVLHSAVVQEATFNIGQDGAGTWSCQGEGVSLLTSNGFSSADAITRGGLSAFPTEPGSPVTNGNILAGFTGLVQVQEPGANVGSDGWDGNTLSPGTAQTIAVIRTANIRVQTQNMLVKDTFGSYYPTLTEGGERTVSTSFSLYDSDDTSTENIKQASYDKTPVTIVYQLGTVAGNIWTFTLSNVQLATYELNDQQLRFSMDVGESRTYSTTLSSLDEMSLVIT